MTSGGEGRVTQEAELGSATIMDVARAAGVSRAAVSKVLRDAYGVSPAMRARVEAAIEQLDYRPRTAARAMRGASFTLGIEIPEARNPFMPVLLSGATRAVAGTRYQLVIAASDGTGLGRRAIEALADRQVDGLVAISPLASTEWLERFARRTPMVMLGRHDVSALYDTIATDDAAGARSVLQHLFDLGHQRITHLTVDATVTVAESRTPHSIRYATYLDEMARAGLERFIDVRHCRNGVQDEAHRATEELLTQDRPPTAIMAGHDDLAMGALRAIVEHAADVSVTGFDNTEISAHPLISLTSVDQSGERLGQRAVELLLERIGGRREAVHEVMPTELKVRGSTRPAPPAPAG